MTAYRTIGVVGGGAWGAALANAAAAADADVVWWMRDAETAASVSRTRINARYLPDARIAEAIRVTSDAGDLAASDAILLVVPTQSVRSTVAGLSGAWPGGAPVVVCAKGIERGTGLFPVEIVRAIDPASSVAVLSGPSFAADVARGLPTAVTLASEDGALAAALAAALSGPTLRVYSGTDVIGVEIGGAAKNVLAIGVGVVEGRGLGESAQAALTARGFAELMRFATACGARAETLMGLSGLGDLVLTCASTQSRNFAFGVALGKGLAPADATGGKLAEGASTAEALVALAQARSIEMPIAEAVADVIAGRLPVDWAIAALLRRPLRTEG